MRQFKVGQLATGSYSISGSFSGSFQGSGAGLNNIPASGIVGLNLSQISTGSVSASVSTGTGSFTVSSGSSTFVFVSSSGNVGIGTNTPTTPLHVRSTSAIVSIFNMETSANAVAFSFNGSRSGFTYAGSGGVFFNPFFGFTGNNVQIGIGNADATARLQVRGSGATSATTALRVENTNTSASMVVLDNGFLGIGRTPTELLHIYTTNQTAIQALETNNANGYSVVSLRNSNVAELREWQLLVYGKNNSANDVFDIYSVRASTTRLRIGSTGNVLIGTTTDAGFKLDVNGTARITGNLNFVGSSQMIFNGAFYNNVNDRNHFGGAVSISTFLRVGTNANTDASSILQADSTTRGFLPPRTNLTSNISTPAQGLMTYVTSSATEGLYYYNSGSYQGWTRTLNDSGSQTITNGVLSVYSTPGTGIIAYVGSAGMIMTGNAGYGVPGISSTTGMIHFNATLNGTGGNEVLNVNKSTNGAYIQAWRSQASATLSLVDGNGNFAIRRTSATASLDVAGTTRISGSFNTATSGSILTVQGSGSAQPIFTVQGSQGELFSITDSLSGSLFSVNDISGLPILEVFSDSSTLIGNYQDPMLITTAKVVQTNSGSFTMYSLPTASYDTAFFEYSVRSGSNARAGTIMAIQSGSAVNFTETTTTDFGSTSAVSFTVIVTGSNMALTGSSTSGAWTIKTIVRGI
jgi:hypothetical protein